MVLFRNGYTGSFILIILIIGVACASFYFTYPVDNNEINEIVSLSPDGFHLECVNRCGNSTSVNSTCQIKCEFILGEGPDQCDVAGAVCISP